MTKTTEQRPAAHEANGRFAKGNPGGPGNPHVRRQSMMRDAVASAVSFEELVEIMQKLVELAKDGDREAAKLVLHYTVGKPSEFQADRRADLETESLLSTLDLQQLLQAEPPKTAAAGVPQASAAPVAAPTPGERILNRRGDREKSMEEMLGLNPHAPKGNGSNGPAPSAAPTTASRPAVPPETPRATKS